MSAKIIDGRAVAASVKERVRTGVQARLAQGLKPPGLATVLVGDDPASHTYVGAKRKACEDLGLTSFHHALAADASEREVISLVEHLSADAEVHGILVQLPLPDQIDEEAVLTAMSPAKDVDGFHENATVTICHSATRDLPTVARGADILIAAVGRPRFVKADWVKPGAAVIDVGVNRVPDDSRKRGYRLEGDVDFEAVQEVAAALTPVPGGVGPMTIAMLMRNTLLAAERVDGRAAPV
jgi:methylenetetrahydrofolate dehydrogenase (NADP+)/methenyltetrahydrofolate cyclohydrolase